MKRILLSAALAFALAASAVARAQSTFVQIYGTFNVDGEYAKADDPSPVPAGINGAVVNGMTRPVGTTPVNNSIPGQFGVSSNASNIGFRGSEDLGGGLKAIFQLESAINLEAGNGGLGSRNSNVGLAGNWGTIFYGIWDTPYKNVTGSRVDPFYATSAPNFNSVYGSPGYNISTVGVAAAPSLTALGANTNDAAGFDRRATNSVQYWTPNFAGFHARLGYSPGESKGSVIPTGYTLPQSANPWLWSVSATYDNGPIFASIGYEQHNDYFGTRVFTGANNATGNSSTDWGAKVVAGVQDVLGGLRLYGIYERLKYKTDGVVTIGQLTDFRRDAFGVFTTYPFGPWTLRAGWMRSNDPSCSAVRATCLDSGLGADKYSIGASYNFSKRTLVYVYWTLQANNAYARYKLGSNSGPVPTSGASTIGIGAEPQAAGLGIRHTF